VPIVSVGGFGHYAEVLADVRLLDDVPAHGVSCGAGSANIGQIGLEVIEADCRRNDGEIVLPGVLDGGDDCGGLG
jgi:hypothetical protein